ncbi:hypothetical protein PsorP6_000101 [Peronosclerospora sorghi]|uniref:Uncharacterized protein n=1 Tax=Peronosclerospora sorghi TaxID=230839 RepID=A0ACC0WY01_9STRA|nr:hypothetical protein PsorP6_000101 [Peronosclerospora sorghi]
MLSYVQPKSMHQKKHVVTALGLKTAIANFIVDTDNAISIVEKRSFIELCTALNSNAPDLLVKASTMSNHIFKLRAETAGAIRIIRC